MGLLRRWHLAGSSQRFMVDEWLRHWGPSLRSSHEQCKSSLPTQNCCL